MKQRKPATVLELLLAARELIGVREHWCFGAMANTKLGRVTAPLARSATSWCTLGALRRVGAMRDAAVYCTSVGLLDDAALELWWFSAVELNDSGKYPLVLEMFDLAIARARELEAQS